MTSVSEEIPKSKRRLRWGQLSLGIALLLGAVALSVYLNSNVFRERVRRYVITELETVTGGRVELRKFGIDFSLPIGSFVSRKCLLFQLSSKRSPHHS